jgi:uncharacterized membrane protein
MTLTVTSIATPRRTRITSIDVLRGLVMIVMVLDHTRDYVHIDGIFGDPTDLATTTPMLFMTRWITHLCAPAFVFLAGVSAYLQKANGMPVRDLSRFLWTRGLWLVVLEFTVVRIGTWFNVDYTFLGVLQVIWTLGVCMTILAALVYMPLSATAGVGIAMIVLHNAFDSVRVVGWQGPGSPVPGVWATLWIVLHQTGEILQVFGGPVVLVIYPLIPWIGVIALGYACGSLYTLDAARRQSLLWRIGLGLVAAFVVLRATNLYGDPSPWSAQPTIALTMFSFIKVTKYPASLLYLLVTLGPSLIALAWFERFGPSRVRNLVVRLGRVPLFFYLLQWPLAHLVAVLASLAAGKDVGYYFVNPLSLATTRPAGAGFDLPVVYLCWLVVLIVLIPLCLWYAGVKERHRSSWLRYL